MLAKSLSFGLIGIEAYPVEVEVDVSSGLPAVTLVGLADASIRESKERVKSAIKNSGFSWPEGRITVSLAPSDVKKEGASFDLAIALGILAATEQLAASRLLEYFALGELSLDGMLRPVRGMLPASIAASRTKTKGLIVPLQNAREAALVESVEVWPIKSLSEAVELLNNGPLKNPFKLDLDALFAECRSKYAVDFSEVKGQYQAKRGLEVAAAGGHNLLMIGPPGSGKTMLAKRLATIIPDLTLKEALEVTKIHSIAGTLANSEGLLASRPFRSPHHTISDIALVGGGSIPQPGEISLAHQGVLFLDELPEFHRNCLESLRQPLEDGSIRICRITKSFAFPASFMLVAAMNPCPCGYYTDHRKACSCNPAKIARYLGRISGPLLDRIDMHLELPAIRYRELADTSEGESSGAIKARVEKARSIQRQRLNADGIFYNSQMNTRLIKKYCRLDDEAKALLKLAMTELGLSARAYDKVLKLSRTIADLAGETDISAAHIAEGVQYRALDRQW